MADLVTAEVVLAKIDQDEDDKGFRTSYVYTGSRTGLESQRIIERGRGAKALSLTPSGDGNWQLTSTFPFDAEGDPGNAEPATDTHDLDSTMVQQDVFLNPKLNRLPADGGLSEANIHAIQNTVLRYKQGEFKSPESALAAMATATIDDGAPNLATARARTAAYFKLIAFNQVDSWIFYRQVYTRTLTAATARQVEASFEGVQKLWTTAQLLAQEQLPNDWWFQLPPDTKWHKAMPSVVTNLGRSSKTQIIYKYIGSDEASSLLYNNY